MSRKAVFQTRRDRDSSTFDNSFQTLGATLTSPAVLLKIQNDSNVDIDISTDGVTDHDFVAQGSFFLYDLRANHGREYDYVFPTGTQIYIKGAAAGAGNVYLTILSEA